MIVGIGIDSVEVPDFARRLEREGGIIGVFSDAERAYADAQPKRRAEILAARWAAREAFGKALGTGLRAEWPLPEIEVTHRPSGRPKLALGPGIAGVVPQGAVLHLSLTHTPTQAAAIVLVEVP